MMIVYSISYLLQGLRMETGAKVDRSDATVTRTHSHRKDYEFYKNKVESTK